MYRFISTVYNTLEFDCKDDEVMFNGTNFSGKNPLMTFDLFRQLGAQTRPNH